jgi:ubiquinone/menaquinone biosynthesis C-methylase UbiE
MSYFATDFENVDGAETAQTFVQCLKLQHSLEFYRRYKEKTFDCLRLAPGASVLEVGCGTGEDAVALAERVGARGLVTAVDRSRAMIDQARAHPGGQALPICFQCADARTLPFPDDTFDGARVDRTLQHIDEPREVVREMARVVRPGGRVVAMEPDWETFTVNSGQRATTRRLLNFWCDSFPSGWVGRYLSRFFREAGLAEVEIFPETLVVAEFDLADRIFDLTRTARAAGEAGTAEPQAVDGWLDELRELDRAGAFCATFTGFIVSGRKLPAAG